MMKMTELKFNYSDIRIFIEFVSEGYKNQSFWEIRRIKYGEIKPKFLKTPEKTIKYLEENEKEFLEWNCYLGALPRFNKSGKEEDIKEGNLFFIDFDSKEAIEDINAIFLRFADFGVRPSFAINSGHGAWLFFKTTDIVGIKKWRNIQKRLFLFTKKYLKEYKPDQVLIDPPRIVRIAGTVNIGKKKGDTPVMTSFLIKDFSKSKTKDLEEIFDIAGIREEEATKIRVERPKRKMPIPEYTKILIKAGVEKGERHLTVWQIAKDLWNCGWNRDEIMEQVLAFNRRCLPPKEEEIIKKHISNITSKADKYLERIDESWLKEHRYGEITTFKKEEKLDEGISLVKLMKKDYPEIKWDIEGLIPEQTINVIASPRKSYKTYIGLYMTACWSFGIPFLNKKVERKNVLYLDSEVGNRLMQKRFKKILNGLGIENIEKTKTRIMSFKNIRIDFNNHVKHLAKVIKKHKIGIIVVDPFKRFHRHKENIADEMSSLYTDYLRPFCEKNNVSAILITHTKKKPIGESIPDKMDMIRGSSEIVNFADNIIMIERNGKSNFVKISHEGARYGKEEEDMGIKLDFDDTTNSVKFVFVPEEEWAISEAPYYAQIIRKWIKRENLASFKTKEAKKCIKDAGKTPHNKMVNEALKSLVILGILDKPKRGVYLVKVKPIHEYTTKKEG